MVFLILYKNIGARVRRNGPKYFTLIGYVLLNSLNMNIKITICCCRCASPSCSKRITSNDYMIVKSTGIVTFRDKNGPVQKREGPVYLHVLEGCMQNYFEDFAYNKVTRGADTMKLLKKEEIDFLNTLGIQHFNYQKQKLVGNK